MNWRFPRCIIIGILSSTLAIPLCIAFDQDFDLHVDSRTTDTVTVSLDGLLRFLKKYPGDDVSEAMAIKLIELHGLSFRPTVEDLVKLKRASASNDLLKAIEAAKKPPPVASKGSLAVACRPVDCAVLLNGKLIGTTADGVLPPITISEGPVIVAATRTSYEPDQRTQKILIRQNETTHIEFTLRPTRSALVAAGATLFRQMLDSLGPAADVSTDVVRAAGTFYVQDHEGRRVSWSVVAWLRARGEARFDVSRIQERYQITRTEAGYVWKRAPKTKEARDLEDGIRLAMDEQLPRVIQHLKDPDYTMVAADLVPGSPSTAILRAEASSGTYIITLDSAHRPCEIELESSGLSSGLRILYSDYTQERGVFYPKAMQIILPDRAGGVEMRFNTVQAGLSENRAVRALSK